MNVKGYGGQRQGIDGVSFSLRRQEAVLSINFRLNDAPR
jgi:hypothetical protein